MEEYGHLLWARPRGLTPMTGKELWRRLRKTKGNTSTGTDAWRGAEVKALPPILLDPFERTMWKIEHGARWPRALLYAVVAMLAMAAGSSYLLVGMMKASFHWSCLSSPTYWPTSWAPWHQSP